ncbi:MAG: rhodanese-like domain-containing protein [Myxococcota bacterium]
MRRLNFDEFLAEYDGQETRLIDVREPQEYDEVRVRSAELFPMSWVQRGEIPENDGRPVALICRSGARSASVGMFLEERGFA